MTLKTHLLLTLITWVGLIPHAWAAEKAKQQEDGAIFEKKGSEKGVSS